MTARIKNLLIILIILISLKTSAFSSEKAEYYIEKGKTLYETAIRAPDIDTYEESLSYFDKALEIDPKNVTALYYKGAIYALTEKEDESLDYFHRALEIAPERGDIWFNMGLACLILNNLPERKGDLLTEGEYAFERAVKLLPLSQEPLLFKAIIAYSSEKNKTGREYLERMEELDPGFKKTDLDFTDSLAGLTPLHYISMLKSDREIVEWFIENGCNINAPDIRGIPPLVYAVSGNATDTAELLITNGADVHCYDNHVPLLIYAVENHNTDIAKLLLSKGAYGDVRSFTGQTPLFEAIDKNDIEMVKLLIKKTEGKNFRDYDSRKNYINIIDKNNITALQKVLFIQ
jgi:tetratricopeptide (TPR) repeat protein